MSTEETPEGAMKTILETLRDEAEWQGLNASKAGKWETVALTDRWLILLQSALDIYEQSQKETDPPNARCDKCNYHGVAHVYCPACYDDGGEPGVLVLDERRDR